MKTQTGGNWRAWEDGRSTPPVLGSSPHSPGADPRRSLLDYPGERGRAIWVKVRAGLHTGECELIGNKPGGIAVHVCARIAALAEPREIL